MAGRGRIPAPIPQFNPREERQSLWRGESTRTLSRPTPPLSSSDHDPLGGGRARRTPRAPLFPGSGARAHTQRRCPLTPRTAHHTPLVAVLQSAARARCTGPTCGRRYERRGSTRGSAPTTSNAPPWHRGADDQAQRTTPGKRSRASTLPLVGAPRQTMSLPPTLSITSHIHFQGCVALLPHPRAHLDLWNELRAAPRGSWS